MSSDKTTVWPWPWRGKKHIALLDERQALLSMKLAGTMGEAEWYRLSCIRGLLDAIEEGKEDAYWAKVAASLNGPDVKEHA